MRYSLLFKIVFLIKWIFQGLTLTSQSTPTDLYKTPLSIFFESTEYQGGIQNWQFAQDSSDILYVANSFGLLEFDGESWNRFNVPNSTKTRALYIDDRNTIYVGGQGQLGYFQLKETGLQFTSLLDKLPDPSKKIDEVWKIFEYKNKIHFQTSSGLIQLKDSVLHSIPTTHAVLASFSLGDRLIVQLQDNQLHEWDGEKFVLYRNVKFSFDVINSLLFHEKSLLVFCENGEVIEIKADGEVVQLKELSQMFKKPLINVAASLSSGSIAIGTQNDGLYILDSEFKLIQHLTRKQGLDHRTVYSLYEDPFENLWVGLNNGISYIELSSPLSLINEEVGLEGTGYTATRHNGQLYLGTNNGLFTQPSSSQERLYKIVSGSEGQVYGLTTVHDKLIMTHHTGAYIVRKNQLSQFFDQTGAWEFIKTPTSEKYIGGTYQGLAIFQNMALDWQVENFEESSRIIEWENDTLLWMTHGYKGAFLIQFNSDYTKVKSIQHFGEKDGFPSNLLISVYRVNDRLIFTSEKGIFEFNPLTKRFDLNSFLTELIGDSHVSKLANFGDGHLLFISNDELGMLKQISFGSYGKEANIFKRVNKYLSNDLENITVLDEYNILIGAKEGFIHFDPSVSFNSQRPFKTLIRSIAINTDENPNQYISSLHFDKSELKQANSISFNYASPYFNGFEDLQYIHRLVPFEKNWSAASSNSTKEYTNLPPGKYRFEVKGVNIYGVEGKTAHVSFKILAPWYKSSWAYVVYGSSGMILFGLISFLQDRKYRSEKNKLSQSSEKAIKEKDQALSELSEKTQKEIEDLKNQKLKSEIHHKNNQLASVTMHLINKNEFVQEVRKRIDHLMQDKNTSPDDLRKIVKIIDRNMTEDDSWDQFSHHFDQVHGDFLKKLNSDVDKLTPQETKLAAYLRMNMSSKEIANLMHISVRGVELARYRLRKKLGLERDQNLNDYLMQI